MSDPNNLPDSLLLPWERKAQAGLTEDTQEPSPEDNPEPRDTPEQHPEETEAPAEESDEDTRDAFQRAVDGSDDPEDEEEEEAGEPQDVPDDEVEYLFELEDGTGVTLEEAKQGYLRQSDYTRKRQAASEDEKRISETAKQYEQRLAAAEELLKGLQPAEPDWDALYKKDPGKYAAERERFRQSKESVEMVRAERQRVANEVRSQQLVKEREALATAWPEYLSDEKIPQQVFDFAVKDLGFPEDQVEQIVDHRVVLLLREAMEYRKIKAAKEDLPNHVVKKKPSKMTLKPGARKRTGNQNKARDRQLAEATRRAKSGDPHAHTERFKLLLGLE